MGDKVRRCGGVLREAEEWVNCRFLEFPGGGMR